MRLIGSSKVGVLVAPAQAAQLKPDTAAAFDRYNRATEAQHADDLRSRGVPQNVPYASSRYAPIRAFSVVPRRRSKGLA